MSLQSVIGGGNRRTRRKPPTCRNHQLRDMFWLFYVEEGYLIETQDLVYDINYVSPLNEGRHIVLV